MSKLPTGTGQPVAEISDDHIESSAVLIKRLAGQLGFIRTLDPLPKRRDETKRFRPKLLRTYGAQCGYDLQPYHPAQLETAHIVPLEIGGLTTEENLILLCRKCHRYYDGG